MVDVLVDPGGETGAMDLTDGLLDAAGVLVAFMVLVDVLVDCTPKVKKS